MERTKASYPHQPDCVTVLEDAVPSRRQEVVGVWLEAQATHAVAVGLQRAVAVPEVQAPDLIVLVGGPGHQQTADP
jgi:hypothetical protein